MDRSRKFTALWVAGALALSATVMAAPSPASPPASPAMSTLQMRIDEAMSLFKQQKYHKASAAFYDLLHEPLPSSRSAEVRFLLGQCLEAINLPLLAGLSYRDVVRLGPLTGEHYARALAAWTTLSFKLDDTIDLEDRVRRLPAAADPANLPGLRYLRGVTKLDTGEIEQAQVFLQEASTNLDTLVGRQAKYMSALASIKTGKRDAAYATLEPLNRGQAKGSSGELTPNEDQVAGRLKDLTLLDQARIRYAQGRYDDALGLYNKLDPKSLYQPRARYEAAWIGFWQDRPLEAVTRLASLKLGSSGGFVAEAEPLAAMIYLRTNQHDEADGVLRGYLDHLYPLRVALRDFIKAHSAREDAAAVVGALFGAVPQVVASGSGDLPQSGDASKPLGEGAKSTDHAADARDPALIQAEASQMLVLKPIVEEMRRDRSIASLLTHANRCSLEAQLLSRQPTWWRGTAIGQLSQGALAKEEHRTLEDAGMRSQASLNHYRMYLSELNVVALSLRREVTVQRLARADKKPDPDPYQGDKLPPFDFLHPAEP